MAKYILHGGKPSAENESNKRFFDEMVYGFEDKVHVLVCVFARVPQRWEASFENDSRILSNNLGDKLASVKLAEPESFEQQVAESEIIYVKGGDTELLSEAFDKFNIAELMQNKLYAGASAGAEILGKQHIGHVSGKMKEGLGIFETNFFVHYKDYDRALLDTFLDGSDYPAIAIEPYEFVTYYV